MQSHTPVSAPGMVMSRYHRIPRPCILPSPVRTSAAPPPSSSSSSLFLVPFLSHLSSPAHLLLLAPCTLPPPRHRNSLSLENHVHTRGTAWPFPFTTQDNPGRENPNLGRFSTQFYLFNGGGHLFTPELERAFAIFFSFQIRSKFHFSAKMEILEFRSQIGYLIDQLPEGIRAIFGRALSVYYLEFDDVSHLFFFSFVFYASFWRTASLYSFKRFFGYSFGIFILSFLLILIRWIRGILLSSMYNFESRISSELQSSHPYLNLSVYRNIFLAMTRRVGSNL